MVARRAGMGARLAARGLLRHRLGAVAIPRPRRRAAADHRLVLRSGAGKWRDRTALRRRRRQFFGLVFRASAADRAGTLRRNPAHDRQGGGRGGKRARQGDACAGLPLSGAAPPQPQGSAWLQGRVEERSPAPPTSSREGWKPIAPGRIAPRRRFRCTICSNASTTSSATGGSLPATSTTGASSTSIRWRACASRTPAPSRRSIAWSNG